MSEARLVQQMLEAVGIRCHTFNEHAAGGLGELAATAVWPEVWIVREQQCSLARSIIEEYERAPEKNIDCEQCGESNPATFEICWRCSTHLTAFEG